MKTIIGGMVFEADCRVSICFTCNRVVPNLDGHWPVAHVSQARPARPCENIPGRTTSLTQVVNLDSMEL